MKWKRQAGYGSQLHLVPKLIIVYGLASPFLCRQNKLILVTKAPFLISVVICRKGLLFAVRDVYTHVMVTRIWALTYHAYDVISRETRVGIGVVHFALIGGLIKRLRAEEFHPASLKDLAL